jgi:hypothetical protein
MSLNCNEKFSLLFSEHIVMSRKLIQFCDSFSIINSVVGCNSLNSIIYLFCFIIGSKDVSSLLKIFWNSRTDFKLHIKLCS